MYKQYKPLQLLVSSFNQPVYVSDQALALEKRKKNIWFSVM